MKRPILYLSGMLLFALASGCSSNVAPPATSPQVNYVAGGTYVYYAQGLDANTGDTVAGSGDTITSKVLTTATTYEGMSSVTEIQNSHSNPGAGVAAIDTTYIAQSNGNYYHYNYGLELLNTNSTILGAANSGKPIKGGWVLQSKLSASPGDTWIAMDTTLTLTLGIAPLVDSVTEASDSSIASAHIAAKHSVHTISLKSTLVNANIAVDSYVSTADGPVLDIFHPAVLAGHATPGRITVFVRAE